ncbi:MAG: hypothetical protein DME04_21180 [Candidatus Rokuibacteriota bacterium]|nr:MAG: hypothetical protein DME04_21180 [Candidatus Rokubacteria bacterium]
MRAPNKIPNRASVPATSSEGSKPDSSELSPIIIWNETDTALSCSAMYGIMPQTTSAATNVPSDADFP